MGILEAAKGILGFGFLGLAFLMAYLGYRLLRAEVAVTNRTPNTSVLGVICFFLIVTISMMAVAGFFEFYRKPVHLLVHFTRDFPEGVELPKIKVRSQTQQPNEERDVSIIVEDEQQVLVILDSLVGTIQDLRRTSALQARANASPNEVGIVDED